MWKITKIEKIAEDEKVFEVSAPDIAASCRPGQFVILRVSEEGERVPLTIADFNRDNGTITLVFQEAGKTTMLLGSMKEGEEILDLAGPLGKPSHFEQWGNVVAIGGGVGIAVVYPWVREAKKKNHVVSILGARSKEYLFWQSKIKTYSDELIITTDDGSYGKKGLVTGPLRELASSGRIDMVFCVGPAIMMREVTKAAKEFNIKTIVSLNSIMVDGTGMCGACRVENGGKTEFACVDGPDFDAANINFDLLMKRLSLYKNEEKASAEHICRCGERKK